MWCHWQQPWRLWILGDSGVTFHGHYTGQVILVCLGQLTEGWGERNNILLMIQKPLSIFSAMISKNLLLLYVWVQAGVRFVQWPAFDPQQYLAFPSPLGVVPETPKHWSGLGGPQRFRAWVFCIPGLWHRTTDLAGKRHWDGPQVPPRAPNQRFQARYSDYQKKVTSFLKNGYPQFILTLVCVPKSLLISLWTRSNALVGKEEAVTRPVS